MRFFVYTVLNAERKCLYVGQTNNVARRMKEHAMYYAWAKDPANVVLTIEFATRAEALEAETWRIAKFRPLHNIRGNPRHITVAEAILNHEWYEEFCALNGLGGTAPAPSAVQRKRDALAALEAAQS